MTARLAFLLALPAQLQLLHLLVLQLFPRMVVAAASSYGGCPQYCLCLSQIQVFCNTGNPGNLTTIPRNFPPETQEIVITNQNITEIPPNAFSHLKHLRRLVLNSNHISVIKPFAFKDLRDMTEISLQNNPLTTLPGFAFAGMRNITNIYLGYNRLNKIDGYAFAGTERIQMLLLNNNPIKIVNGSAFSGLKDVEFLFLPAGVKTLQSDAFNGLEHVGVLKLAYLDLTELSPYTFRGLKRVRILSIENSDLATVREGAFLGVDTVGELKIANNKIDRIEDMSVSPEVRKLTLRGNHILEVPSPHATRNIRVRQIEVVSNHFPCNCRVLYLLESPLGNGTDFLRENKCISPFSLNGRPMSDMGQIGVLGQCRREDLDREEEERRQKQQQQQQRRRKEMEKKRLLRQQQQQQQREQRRRKSSASSSSSSSSSSGPTSVVSKGKVRAGVGVSVNDVEGGQNGGRAAATERMIPLFVLVAMIAI